MPKHVCPLSNVAIESPQTCPYKFGEFTCTYRGSERCNFTEPVLETGPEVIPGKYATS